MSSEPNSSSNYRYFFFYLLVNYTLPQFFTVYLKQASIIFLYCKWSLGLLIANFSDLSQFASSLCGTPFLLKKNFFWLPGVLVVAGRFSEHVVCFVVARAKLPQGMWDLSSLARDGTHILCLERQILNHWTTREVPILL